jgi:hypothetical protein
MIDTEIAKIAAAYAWCEANPDRLWSRTARGHIGVPLAEWGDLCYRDIMILAYRAGVVDDPCPHKWHDIGKLFGITGRHCASLAKKALPKLMASSPVGALQS